MFFAADNLRNFVCVGVGVLEHAQPELRQQQTAAAIRQQRRVNLIHHAGDVALTHAAHDVRTRLHRDDVVQTPVGLDNAVVAQTAAQNIVHDHRGFMRVILHRVAAEIRDGRIAVRHDGRGMHRQRRLKDAQRERFVIEPQRRAVHAARLRAGAGEMLHAGHDGINANAIRAVLQSRNRRDDHRLGGIRVLAVSFLIAPPARVSRQVRVRGEAHANTQRLHFLPLNVCQLLHEFRVARRAQRDGVRQNRRVVNPACTNDRVHGEDDRNTQFAFFAQGLDVVHLLARRLLAFREVSVRQRKADVQIAEPAFFERDQRHVRHLRRLVLVTHAAQQVFRALFRRQTPIFIRVKLAVFVQVLELVAVLLQNIQSGSFQHNLLSFIFLHDRRQFDDIAFFLVLFRQHTGRKQHHRGKGERRDAFEQFFHEPFLLVDCAAHYDAVTAPDI